jgi:hypothetical protein
MDAYKLKNYISVCKRLDISNIETLLNNIKGGGNLLEIINSYKITDDELDSTKKLCDLLDLNTLKSIYADYHIIVGGKRGKRGNGRKKRRNANADATRAGKQGYQHKKENRRQHKKGKSGSDTDTDSFSFSKSETTSDGQGKQRLTRSQKKQQKREKRQKEKEARRETMSSSSEGTQQSSSDGSTSTQSRSAKKKERKRQRLAEQQGDQQGLQGDQQRPRGLRRQMGDIIDLSGLSDLTDSNTSLSDTSDDVPESTQLQSRTHTTSAKSGSHLKRTTESMAHDLLKTGLSSGIQGLKGSDEAFKSELRKLIQSTLRETVSEVLTEQVAPELEEIVKSTMEDQKGGFDEATDKKEDIKPIASTSDSPVAPTDKKAKVTYETLYDHNKIVQLGSDICYCTANGK